MPHSGGCGTGHGLATLAILQEIAPEAWSVSRGRDQQPKHAENRATIKDINLLRNSPLTFDNAAFSQLFGAVPRSIHSSAKAIGQSEE